MGQARLIKKKDLAVSATRSEVKPVPENPVSMAKVIGWLHKKGNESVSARKRFAALFAKEPGERTEKWVTASRG